MKRINQGQVSLNRRGRNSPSDDSVRHIRFPFVFPSFFQSTAFASCFLTLKNDTAFSNFRRKSKVCRPSTAHRTEEGGKGHQLKLRRVGREGRGWKKDESSPDPQEFNELLHFHRHCHFPIGHMEIPRPRTPTFPLLHLYSFRGMICYVEKTLNSIILNMEWLHLDCASSRRGN
jgi:hypothetical protein